MRKPARLWPARPAFAARLVARSLAGDRRATAWTVATLTACATLVVAFTTVSLEADRQLRHTLRRLGANAVVQAAPPAGHGQGRRPETWWPNLAARARAAGAAVVVLHVRPATAHGVPAAIVRADSAALAGLTPYWQVRGRRPGQSGECAVGQRLAERLGVGPGDALSVSLTGEPAGTGGAALSCGVVGVVAAGDEDDGRLFVARVGSAGAFENVGAGAFAYALVSVAGGEGGIADLRRRLRRADAGVEVYPLRQIVSGEARILRAVNLLARAAVAAVWVLAALGVSTAALARVVERRRELALLQALGARRRSVVTLLLAESLILALLSTLLGFGAGTALAGAVAHQVFQVGVAPRVESLAAAAITAGAVALLAAALSGRRAVRLLPAAALRGE